MVPFVRTWSARHQTNLSSTRFTANQFHRSPVGPGSRAALMDRTHALVGSHPRRGKTNIHTCCRCSSAVNVRLLRFGVSISPSVESEINQLSVQTLELRARVSFAGTPSGGGGSTSGSLGRVTAADLLGMLKSSQAGTAGKCSRGSKDAHADACWRLYRVPQRSGGAWHRDWRFSAQSACCSTCCWQQSCRSGPESRGSKPWEPKVFLSTCRLNRDKVGGATKRRYVGRG